MPDRILSVGDDFTLRPEVKVTTANLPASNQRGIANGVAPLDGNARVPEINLPAGIASPAARPDLVSTLPPTFTLSHRGGPLNYPEHSVEGHRAAARAGQILEVDVQILNDGTLVVHHDSTVDRTTLGTGAVTSFTYATWQKLAIKPPVPGGDYARSVTWAQVADEFGGRHLIAVEQKVHESGEALRADIVRRGLQRAVIYQSFSQVNAKFAADLGIAACFLSDSANPLSVAADGIEFVGVSLTASQTYIDSLKAQGLKVIAYTATTKATHTAQLAKGIAGVFSDDPEWTNGFYPVGTRDVDPYRERKPWPGMRTFPTHADRGRFVAPKWWGFATTPAGAYRGVPQGWSGPRAVSAKANVTIKHGAASTAQDRWASVFFGVADPEDGYKDSGSETGRNGYHALVRRNGALDLYVVTNGVPSGIGSAAALGTPLAGAGVEGAGVVVELEINATNVIFRDITNARTITVANTTHRTGGYFQFGASGTAALFADVSITDI